MTTRAATRVLMKYARPAGIEVTPHQLRHTICKRLLDQGVSLDQVAVLVEHSNLNTAARYVRPSVQNLERAVERLAWAQRIILVFRPWSIKPFISKNRFA